MRRFLDEAGIEWTVALSSGSYGSMVLVFSATGDTAVYSLALEAATAAEGRELLDGLPDGELRRRLARATPWNG